VWAQQNGDERHQKAESRSTEFESHYNRQPLRLGGNMQELNCEGKRVSFTDRNGKKIRGRVRKCIVQTESEDKMLVFQKIDFSESRKKPPIRFRIGYYVAAKNKSHWVWARNSPIFNKKDFDSLMQKAHSKKGFLET
jgi:hypothetical protein